MSHSIHTNPTRPAGKPTLTKPLIVSKAAPAARGPIPEQQRHVMIAEAAYYMAERRGFESGRELEDWLQAESQIETAIAGGNLPKG